MSCLIHSSSFSSSIKENPQPKPGTIDGQVRISGPSSATLAIQNQFWWSVMELNHLRTSVLAGYSRTPYRSGNAPWRKTEVSNACRLLVAGSESGRECSAFLSRYSPLPPLGISRVSGSHRNCALHQYGSSLTPESRWAHGLHPSSY